MVTSAARRPVCLAAHIVCMWRRRCAVICRLEYNDIGDEGAAAISGGLATVTCLRMLKCVVVSVVIV
jgi:hypothetical protein